MRVLLAEDEAVTRAILQRTVEKFGHECLVVGAGEEALMLYRETTCFLKADLLRPTSALFLPSLEMLP